MSIQKVDVHSDSRLVVNQLQGTYQARHSKITAYLTYVKELQSSFEEFIIIEVPKLENGHDGTLANLGLAIQATTS